MTKLLNNRLSLAVVTLLVVQAVLGSGTAQSAPSLSDPVVHIVRPGENLFRIALRYGTTVQAIMQTNDLTSTTIYVGQRLVIPGSYVPSSLPSSTYIVQPGDTLYSIALRFGTTVLAISQANGLLNPHIIYAGQRLQIPGVPAAQATTPPDCGTWYTVQPGDTLSALALRYGTSVWMIASVNNLPNPNHTYVGQRLFVVPCGNAPAAPLPAAVSTATPTPTPTPTPSVSPTVTPTLTPTPTPTPGLLEPPVLFEPESGAHFPSQVRLKWIWPRRLESHERFAVQWLPVCCPKGSDVWVSEGEIIGSDGAIHEVAGGYRFELNFDLAPYPKGEAYWRVAVFGQSPSEKYQISQWSEQRQIFRGQRP
jgi:LysM repeat protein